MRACLVLIVLIALPSKALAEGEAENKVFTQARLAPVLPVLRIAGGTDENAKIQASLDAVVGIADAWDLSIAPTLEVASPSGVASLFAFEEGELHDAKSWSGGFSVSFLNIPTETRKDREGRSKYISGALKEAHAACMRKCASAEVSEEDNKFCADFGGMLPANIDLGEYCAAGKKVFARDPLFRDLRSIYPRFLISAGGLIGGTEFEYLEADPDKNLSPKENESRRTGTLAGSFTWVEKDSGFTFEVPLVYSSDWKAAEEKARWCTPVGQVPREGTPPEGPPLTDPATSCREKPLGAPSRSWRLFTTVQLGYVDIRSSIDDNTPRTYFRFSAGPAVDYESKQNKRNLSIGLQVPMYINFASAPAYNAGNYKGLIRVVPSFSLVRDLRGPEKWEPRAELKLELLAERSLFARALEWR